jgi:hypothetical protein
MSKNYFWLWFGQRCPKFNYDDVLLVKKIKRLYLKHNRLAEAYCNGWVDETEFDTKIVKIENTIESLIKGNDSYGVKFQNDPRGYTVSLFYEDVLIEWESV